MGIMLEIIIYFAIFSVILKLSDAPFVKKIKEAANVYDAIEFKKELIANRKKLLHRFIIVVVLFELILMIINIVIVNKESSSEDKTFLILVSAIYFVAFIVLLIIYVDYSNKNNKFLGNLSVEKAADYLNSENRFILYLRGFESDVYSDLDVGKYDFSEDVLSKVVQKGFGLQLCAVGMTKEVSCPLGGRRLYVEDEVWENEVFELMKKAEKIVYLINDRPSCIWEIQKSKDVYQKCIFVVDDLIKYDNVRKMLKGTINLPDIPISDIGELSTEYDPRRFYFASDNVMKPFEGEVSDYCEMLGLNADAVTEADIKADKKEPFFKRPFFIFLMMIAAGKAIVEIIDLFK